MGSIQIGVQKLEYFDFNLQPCQIRPPAQQPPLYLSSLSVGNALPLRRISTSKASVTFSVALLNLKVI